MRVGSVADYRLASLDATLTDGEGRTGALAEIVPDWEDLQAEGSRQLMPDVDRALEHLEPELRDVLVGRFLNGESSAEISRRYHAQPSSESHDATIAFVLAHRRFLSS